ncbi:MAG TPA: hypothetical protein GXZ22_09930 [Clostridiaceae bacterium]|jgi:hypothetical protein|nr:hypothetical protein [Clostridiaceae bacterium]
MIKRELYEKVYNILDKVTPLQSDCGELCGKACCQSPDEDAGMYLFPGEEIMFTELPSWLKIEVSDFTYGDNKPVLIAICSDKCQRELRPLACRIFPLTPYMTRSGVMSIKIDPRAIPMCPLAKEATLDETFVSAVARVFKLLSKEKEIQSFVLAVSRLIDEQERILNFFVAKQKAKKQRRAIRRKKY